MNRQFPSYMHLYHYSTVGRPYTDSRITTKKINARWYTVGILCALSSPSSLSACTGIRIKTTDGASIYARTMEFPFDLKSAIIAIPKNKALAGTLPDGTAGIKWKTKYAAVGINALKKDHFLDGVNEKGLAFGALYFPGYAHYQPIAPHEHKVTLAPWELGTWLLTTCATVDDVKRALEKIKIGAVSTGASGIVIEPMGPDFVPPLHYIVHDAQGNSIVIEPNKKTLTIQDNPIGTITNSPYFDWHLINLKNYVNLTPYNAPSVHWDDFTIYPAGQGSGMLGLPGDFTPPSRFIRAASLSIAALPAATAYDGVGVAISILNNITIAKGMIRETEPTGIIYEYTHWISVADLKNCCFYYRTYENHCYHQIDLKTLIFEDSKIKRLGMEEKAVYDNVTEKLK
ncbi:choloylglycine hydrolase [Candidatus Dependentiae bacterium HGW-Dependentiae-1]|nr:MAG: choloylglycine hydrolase [Candidatus Dependentiae bacterium HGW-Dependentiae-1]